MHVARRTASHVPASKVTSSRAVPFWPPRIASSSPGSLGKYHACSSKRVCWFFIRACSFFFPCHSRLPFTKLKVFDNFRDEILGEMKNTFKIFRKRNNEQFFSLLYQSVGLSISELNRLKKLVQKTFSIPKAHQAQRHQQPHDGVLRSTQRGRERQDFSGVQQLLSGKSGFEET